MTVVYVLALVALILFGLWLTGRRWMVREINDHAKSSETVVKYHNDLVEYVDSGGTNSAAMNELMMSSTKVESALGADNWIVGARVGRNIYNGVPAVPYAIREIHETIRDRLWHREAYQAAELVRNLLLRHIGRRKDEIERLALDSEKAFHCIGLGWRLWAAIPLYVLSGLGLVKNSTVRRARNSKVFSFYSLILFLAAIAAPALAYLADRSKIDTELTRMLGS